MIGTFPPNTEFSEILLTLFKWLLVIGAGFYTVFAFVVIRQIQVMKKTLITTFSSKITILGLSHLAFAFGVLILFIFVL